MGCSAALQMRHEKGLFRPGIKFTEQLARFAILGKRNRSKPFVREFLEACFRSRHRGDFKGIKFVTGVTIGVHNNLEVHHSLPMGQLNCAF